MDNSGLILASRSPRRKYLLEQAGLDFMIVPSQVEERHDTGTPPEKLVQSLAEAKAQDVAGRYPGHWIIGADTIVLVDDTVLGKPNSVEDAREMMDLLNGSRHQVLTGYTVCHKSKHRCISETVRTDVYFKRLSQAELDWYLQTDEPFDKAGAYAIQGLGMFLVKAIDGSYTNVVGLPVCEVLDRLYRADVIEPVVGGGWQLRNDHPSHPAPAGGQPPAPRPADGG